MVYEPRPDEIEEADDDWLDEFGDELDCTWCGGDGWQENDDPLWYDGDIIPCQACDGTGLRKHQTVF